METTGCCKVGLPIYSSCKLCALLNVLHFVTFLLLFLSLNVLNGFVAKPFFLIIGTLLNISFLCNLFPLHSEIPSCNCGTALVIIVGDLSLRLIKAAKAMGVHVEDPFVLVFNGSAFSTDGPLPFLKHSIRNSYRQLLLQRSVHRRIDCAGPTTEVDIPLTRKYFLSLTQPLHKLMVRYFLTGALDHNQRLFKANLSPTPICPHYEQAEETAHHIFWECCSWHSVRTHYPILMKLYSLCGAIWPNTLLHCEWVDSS